MNDSSKPNHLPSKQLLRQSKPAPIDIPRRSVSDSTNSTAPRSGPSSFPNPPNITSSPVQMSYSPPGSSNPTSTSHSYHSTHSNPHPHSHIRRRSSDDYRRYAGTVNHYGRHSNDWLFGGFSLRDTVKDGVDKLKQHHHQSHHKEG